MLWYSTFETFSVDHKDNKVIDKHQVVTIKKGRFVSMLHQVKISNKITLVVF